MPKAPRLSAAAVRATSLPPSISYTAPLFGPAPPESAVTKRPPQLYDLTVPPHNPDQYWPQLNNLRHVWQGWAKEHGYHVLFALKDVGKRYTIECKHSGLPSNRHNLTDESRKRYTHSTKSECPFRFVVRWNVQHSGWKVLEHCAHHNHSALPAFAYHPNRSISSEHFDYIMELKNAHVSRAKILSRVRGRDSSCLAIPQDLSNLVTRVRMLSY